MDASTTALMEQNLYELIDPSLTISIQSDSNELRRAYHKQARALHPDKNPHDQFANEKFDRLKKVYEILSDPKKRAEFDKLHNERQNKVQQRENEDASIRAMRDKLEQREQAAANQSINQSINRNARAAADRRRTENESIVESMRKSNASPGPFASSINQSNNQSFNQSNNQSNNQTISLTLSPTDTEKSLQDFFSSFGSIELFLMKTKKAYITFFDRDAVTRAINQSNNQSNNQNIQMKFDHWKIQIVGKSDNQSNNQSNNQSINQPTLTSYEALTEYETTTFERLEEAIRKRSSNHRPVAPVTVQ